MNSDAEYGGSGTGGNGKLRQWLIEQVDCDKYPGLVWENDEKSIFRIPWKHAGKQDYNRDEDAALFKAWALFKGKFREGIDKPDPPTWKTRLRCALNKSNDFEELVERSQLDISDPYKVYRIVPEGAKKRPRQEDSPLSPGSFPVHPSFPALQTQLQMPGYVPPPSDCGWRDFVPEQPPLSELSYAQCPFPPRGLSWPSPPMEDGLHIKGTFYSCGPADSQASHLSLDAVMRPTEHDFRLHVSVYVRDILVTEGTTSSPEGCHLAPCPADRKPYMVPGRPELVALPQEGFWEDGPPSPSALEEGVLLWMRLDGLYARRLCQQRVYWQGGPGPYGDKVNKLERGVTCKLLHTQDYITDIQSFGFHGRPPPRFQVLLSFGDECPDPPRHRGPLTVQVEPLVGRHLLFYAQQSSAPFYRSYEAPGVSEHLGPCEEYSRTFANTPHPHSTPPMQH